MSHKNYPSLKRYLLSVFADEIPAQMPILHLDFSNVIERYWGIDYQSAKGVIITLWRGYREELRPLYAIVKPDAPVEIDRCFREARGEEVSKFSDWAHKWT